MKILCIYTDDNVISVRGDIKLNHPSDMPFGISMVATALRQDGNDVRMLVLSQKHPYENVLHRILSSFAPALVCFTPVSSQFEFTLRLAAMVKRTAPGTYVTAGGIHPTLNPGAAISHDCFDAVCVGEGEGPAKELARQLQAGRRPDGIENLWIRKQGGEVQENPARPFVQDLDSLPHMDRGLWDNLIRYEDDMVSILLGRGCPNRCTYCSNHALRTKSSGRYVRMRTPGDIIKELDGLTKQNPRVGHYYLEVETLGANHEYLFELCSALAEFNGKRGDKPLKFGVNYALSERVMQAPELVDRTFQAFNEAGIYFMNIGLESGSERIRKEVLRRPNYSNESIIRFCLRAREFSVDVRMYILMGVPGETCEDFQETVRVTRACRTTSYYLNVYYPYPGTDLYEVAREQGLIVDSLKVSERTQSKLSLPGFSRYQMAMQYVLFYFRVYRGYKPLSNILRMTLWLYLRKTNPSLLGLRRKIKIRVKEMFSVNREKVQ